MNDECKRCGSLKSFTTNEEYSGNVLCEYNIKCAFCGYPIDFFAYGNFESDAEKGAFGKYKWCLNNSKVELKFIILYVYYRIKRRYYKNNLYELQLCYNKHMNTKKS